jgi:hypothetical protein
VTACGHGSPIGALRFKNQDPVWRVDDRRPLAAKPSVRHYHRLLYHADGYVVRRTTRALELRPHRRARDVNSLDEVPDSSWFTNRIGVRDMTLDELRRGPNVSPSPFEHLPWTITGTKSGGMSLGFVFRDALGAKFILKFDRPELPEMETAADVIVQRILFALGYNVPEDYVGEIDRGDLRIAPGVTTTTSYGKREALTDAALDRSLATVAKTPDGNIRVLASRLIAGSIVGPYAREGTRSDDPNDMIAHEDRRSLRGQYPIFAWLGHTDLQEDNTLDSFVDGHVVHYLLDFGKALGVMGTKLRWKTIGYTYRLDVGRSMRDLLTLGLLERPYDGLSQPPLRGVGLFDVAHYQPGSWRPNSIYWPLLDKDRFDGFWGAKLIMRFTREQLAAIVAEGKLSDPRSAAYLVDTLVARQRKTARYWFAKVAPLDRFAVRGAPGGLRLAFTDLLVAYRLDDVPTIYIVDVFDRRGRAIGAPRAALRTADGRVEIGGLALATGAGGYTIVRIRVARNHRGLPPIVVHVASDGAGGPRVIGLRRY